jgi:hypothetical protein
MFGWFERRLNPYPEAQPSAPPHGLLAFCWHYSREAAPWLIAMAILTALISIGEVMLFGFLGSIVDWLATSDPQGFLEREAGRLMLMGAIGLIGLPVTVLLHSMIIHQTLLGQLPDDRALADAPLPAAPEPELLFQRICRPGGDKGDADVAVDPGIGDEAARRLRLCLGLFHRDDRHGGQRRVAAGAADAGLAGGLCRADCAISFRS